MYIIRRLLNKEEVLIQKLLFVFILLLTDLVFSQSKKTEFFWQPGSSQSDFSIIGQYTSNIIEYTTGSLKVKQETISTNFGIAYNYGLSEIMAIGIEVNSPSITQKIKLNGTSFSETKLSGLGDIEFNFKSHLPLAGGNFVFQTYVSFSPGDQEIKTDSGGNSTVNGYSGGAHDYTSTRVRIAIRYKFFNICGFLRCLQRR